MRNSQLTIALCGSLLFSGSPWSLAAQETSAGLSVGGGWYHPDGFLRLIPRDGEAGGDERTHLTDGFVVNLAADLATPFRFVRTELTVSRTFGSRLAVREMHRVNCGPDCTRAFEKSVTIGDASVSTLGANLLIGPLTHQRIALVFLCGASLRRYAFDGRGLGSRRQSFAGDEIRGALQYGIRLTRKSHKVSLFAEAIQHRGSFPTPVRDEIGMLEPASTAQHDLTASIGLGFTVF